MKENAFDSCCAAVHPLDKIFLLDDLKMNASQACYAPVSKNKQSTAQCLGNDVSQYGCAAVNMGGVNNSSLDDMDETVCPALEC